MRPLLKPPQFTPQALAQAAPPLADPALTAFIAKANTEYYHWEQLRRHPIPLGLSTTQALMALKATRLASRRALPLLDVGGRPFSYWLPDQAFEVLHIVDRQGGGALAGEADERSVFAGMRDRVLIDSL